MFKMKKINIILFAFLIVFVQSSCSDFKDYNDDNGGLPGVGTKTLWENISENSQLSNFAQLVKSSGMAEELDAAHCYTVWAPLDGTYDAEALKNTDPERVLKEFVKNHIAEFNHPLTGEVDERIYTLNDKSHVFSNISGNKFGEAEIGTANIPAINGVMHILNNKETFRYSGYEYLDYVTGCDDYTNYLKGYEYKYLDEKASVKGPIIRGLQTWIDSVMVVTNDLVFNDMRAKINEEDSDYVVLMPVDSAWAKVTSNAAKCFNYLTSFKWQDLSATGTTTSRATAMTATLGTKDYKDSGLSIYQDSLSKSTVAKNLVYSKNLGQNKQVFYDKVYSDNDTVYTTTHRQLTNVVKLMNSVIDSTKMSNGWTMRINDVPYLPWETYNPEISTRSIGRSLTCTPQNASISKKKLDPAVCVLPDEMDQLSYIRAEATTSSGKPELDFYLNNVRSTTYNIYVITVPACAEDSAAERKPYSLFFDLSYTNASGALQKLQINKDEKNKKTAFETDPNKVDTICVLKDFTFPISYYGLDAAPNLKVAHSVTSFTKTNREKYEQTLRIAAVVLRPIELDEAEPFIKEEE